MAYRYGPSHGSILQTYALTKVLEYYGHKVEIINRQPPFRINDLIICLKRVIKLFVKGRLTRYDFYVGQYPKIMMRGINSFIDCNLREKTISFSSSLKLKHIGNGNYQAFIVGSDEFGEVDLTCFPDVYKKFNNIKVGNIIKIFGRVEKRYDKYQVIINNISILE